MIDINPKFITNSEGEQFVIISQNEFDNIIEALEGQEDVQLYDEVKKEDDGTRVIFSDYLKNRGSENT